ncbi:hypothetical protein D9758_018262 [Tetrapyrgos nigripes]|uniref:Uncharacterized protein n=1 Tax=Tetrapyrgos nigripes TaxID=182062 RepID=A0A8H5FC10_9AGAR|nr:hypothetical protein D9758_018262 [Tetrapyrgos nigripes]
MARWLERREKVLDHSTYISWRLSPDSTPSSFDTDVEINSSSGRRYDFPGSRQTLSDLKCTLTSKMTRNPTIKSVPLIKIEDTSPTGYGATQFVHALKRFIVQFRDPDVRPADIEDWAKFVTLPFRRIPVWHKVKFVNHDLYGKETLDSVCARPRRMCKKANKVIQASQFDPALIQIKDTDDGNERLHDMRIGRVRVIFSFPMQDLETLFPSDMPPPPHLAYVEWYTKFSARGDPYSGLHKVKRQISGNSPSASIIPLEKIRRSIHLFPKWGGVVPGEWSSETVLDDCDTFWVNIFKDNISYFNLS